MRKRMSLVEKVGAIRLDRYSSYESFHEFIL